MFSEEKCPNWQTPLDKDICLYFIARVLQQTRERQNFNIFKIQENIQNQQFISASVSSIIWYWGNFISGAR
jgi:hypothetical protein